MGKKSSKKIDRNDDDDNIQTVMDDLEKEDEESLNEDLGIKVKVKDESVEEIFKEQLPQKDYKILIMAYYNDYGEIEEIKKIKTEHEGEYTQEVLEEIEEYILSLKMDQIVTFLTVASFHLYERIMSRFLRVEGLASKLIENEKIIKEARQIFLKNKLISKAQKVSTPEFTLGLMVIASTYQMHRLNSKEPKKIAPPDEEKIDDTPIPETVLKYPNVEKSNV